jgi:hypothetical protein
MTEGNGNGNGAVIESHLDWLRARHDVLKADRHHDLEVPGYEGRLVIRCGPIPWPVLAKMQRQLADDADGRGLLVANQDAIIAATREVLFDGAPIDPSGEPRKLDPALAELLGSDTKTAREMLTWLFPHELNIATAAGELGAWTQDANAETNRQFVGE